MARPTKTRTTTTTTRTTRSATSRRAGATVDAVDEDVEEAGLGLVDGLVIVTTLFLLLGLGTVDWFLGAKYGAGFLF